MKRLVMVLSATLFLSACSNSVRTPTQLGQVETNSAPAAADATASGERYDPAAEEAISRDAIAAWRTAVSHAKRGSMTESEWKKQREADEKSAMDQLTSLKDRFPTSSTVRFMMGQVKEHFGKHDEAVEQFRQSMVNNTNNTMFLFKLAESESKAGRHEDAIKHYRQLLAHERHGFADAEVGLARSLLAKDPANAEAKQILQALLRQDPQNERARELLAQSK